MKETEVPQDYPSKREVSDGTDSDVTPAAPRHFPVLLVSLVTMLVALPPLTYMATTQNWLPLPLGPVYLHDEHTAAIEQARQAAHLEGRNQGYDAGHTQGIAQGKEAGYGDGFGDGRRAGYSDGSAEGYDDGYLEGSVDGYSDGFTAGCQSLFDGLNTDRVGDWWDYYYAPSYASYFLRSACGYGF